MVKVGLVSPKGNIFGKNEKMNCFLDNNKNMLSFKHLWTGPNLALLTIGALLPDEWQCEYIDENYQEINFSTNYDIVFISAMTQQVLRAYQISEWFRKKGICTVIGGIHATVLFSEAKAHCDVVFIGEVETVIEDFIQDFSNRHIKPYYREIHPGTYMFQNAPIPRFDLLQNYHYPLISLQTTRGCPHDCSFCAASKVYGKKYRRKNNSQIIKELNTISTLYPGTLILFADDNLFVRRQKTKELLREMIGMDLRWIAQTDISIANDVELLTLMTLAGCQWIVIGFESVSYDSLLNLDEKNWKLKQFKNYRGAIKMIQSYGIGIYGTFIVGLDSDGIDVFQSTADFILNSNMYGANITAPTPLPGTKLRDNIEKEGRLLHKGWDYYTFWDVTMKPKKFTVEELEDGILSIYQRINDNAIIDRRLQYLRHMSKNRRKIIKDNLIYAN